MQNINGMFLPKIRFVSLFLVFSLFFLGAAAVVFSQVVPVTEICNGLDDSGDGVADEGINCDHYLSYLLDRSIDPIKLVLRDQFINPTDFTLTLIERIFNPVRKIHAGLAFNPERTDLHYLGYRLKSEVPFVPRVVSIENQFEKRDIVVTEPRYLLAPTGKRKTGVPIERLLSILPPHVANKLVGAIVPPIPDNANHYLCYDIEPYSVAQGLGLKDQFQNRQFEVTRALYLCNPAEKNHDGRISKIVDENNHLMCYEVVPHNPQRRPVLTHDQFGIKSLKPVRTEEVCLPTVKTLRPLSCTRPDEHGTAAVFDLGTTYQNTLGQVVIVQPTPVGEGLLADLHMASGPDTLITRTGSPDPGESYTFDTEILQLSLTGSGQVLNIPINGEIKTSSRMAGDPVQSFDTDMFRLQGTLPPGDPDFDLLRITAGADFGLPSPGHTTLTKLPDGTFAVDSFFDITYRIDFVGAAGGSLAGQNGSHVGTVRLGTVCPVSHSQ